MLKDLIYKRAHNKKVLILGFGREGQSTFKLLRKLLPEQLLTIADKDTGLKESSELIKSDNNVNLILGEQYLDSLQNFDLVIKSPGVALHNWNKSFDKTIVSSQTDLFINAYSDRVIGITGTKGKSTTASLIFHLLKQNSENVIISGNIGIPPFDIESDINESSTIILELSAHQLESISASPKTAIILNIYPEHLDHFGDFEKYRLAKLNILKYQKAGDNLIIPKRGDKIQSLPDNEISVQNIYEYSVSGKVKQGCYINKNSVVFLNKGVEQRILTLKNDLPLAGEHNLLNIMAAINVCMIYGVPKDHIPRGILSFKPLEHRMEFVGEHNGVRYYNDSISTIPESTIYALMAIKGVNTLILGGFDRGIDYDNLINYIITSEVENIILTGSVGKRIFGELAVLLKKHQQAHFTDNFTEAVYIATGVTKRGTSCLFSPAAASYDKFKNFEERGKVFKELISRNC